MIDFAHDIDSPYEQVLTDELLELWRVYRSKPDLMSLHDEAAFAKTKLVLLTELFSKLIVSLSEEKDPNIIPKVSIASKILNEEQKHVRNMVMSAAKLERDVASAGLSRLTGMILDLLGDKVSPSVLQDLRSTLDHKTIDAVPEVSLQRMISTVG
jgi:hypothetical protein